jgi:hypothetical protein
MSESKYEAIRAILVEWDPIGVSNMPGAQDEYDAYVPEVAQLISKTASVEEIFSYLWQLETEHIGLVGNEPKTRQIATRLLGLKKI